MKIKFRSSLALPLHPCERLDLFEHTEKRKRIEATMRQYNIKYEDIEVMRIDYIKYQNYI